MVLDTSILVSLQLEEPGYRELFKKITDHSLVIVGAPSVLEAVMVLSGRSGSDARPILHQGLQQMNIKIVPFTERHYNTAVAAFLRFGKGRHPAKLNFGDCMSYAIAAVAGMPLLYTGGGFALTDIQAA